jgi:hypothetical protein
MNAGEDTVLGGADSFEALLDTACSRLWDRKLRYTLRRLGELDGILDTLDRELEAMGSRERILVSPSAKTAPAGSGVP